MRFLVDECTGPRVAAWLRSEGYEVFSVYEELRGATDEQLLSKANAEGWVVVTNDKDFGELIYREQRPHCGVIFLRLADERWAAKIEVIRKLLKGYPDRIENALVVVTEHQARFSES